MGTIKVKKDGEWVKLPNYGVEAFPDAPSDGKTYGRNNGAWSEIVSSNQYLDIVTLFPDESGTLSDENYQKVVDAVNKGITTSSSALPQETQNNILDAINSIKFTDKSKTTVTAQEYNNIISAFDGKITPNNDNMYNISYDKMIPSKFTATGTEAPIFGGYLVFDEFSTISLISYSTFYDYYYAIMANANVGGTTLEIKNASNNYTLTYKNNTGIPVTGGNGVSEIASLSQSAYDGLTEKKNTTLYIITG